MQRSAYAPAAVLPDYAGGAEHASVTEAIRNAPGPMPRSKWVGSGRLIEKSVKAIRGAHASAAMHRVAD
jgi:hypothetical protein